MFCINISTSTLMPHPFDVSCNFKQVEVTQEIFINFLNTFRVIVKEEKKILSGLFVDLI